MLEWINRQQALDQLGVKPQTLYAYVSRGLIGVCTDPQNPRLSLYRAEDISTLSARRTRGKKRSAVAESVMSWGEPALSTSISTCQHGVLYYRGIDAAQFSRSASLEDTAALLWDTTEAICFRTGEPFKSERRRDSAFVTIANAAATDQSTLGRSRTALCVEAAGTIAKLAGAFGADQSNELIHLRLARSWSTRNDVADVIRQALVLVADHELNASAFAARVTASTGASIAACLLTGMSALSGPRHGGMARAVAAVIGETRRIGIEVAIARWLDQDRPLPGFGHPLYPRGDPRAIELLERIQIPTSLKLFLAAAENATGSKPNIDFALFAISKVLGLPSDAPFRLFALGRSVGWAAHAMEQIGSGKLIRPRARYEGPLPTLASVAG